MQLEYIKLSKVTGISIEIFSKNTPESIQLIYNSY